MRHTKPGYIAAPVFARERTHRRGVLAAMGFLLLFSMSPVFGHHVAEPLTAALAGRDHFLSVCLVALHLLLAPVHSAFHLLVGAGLIYAIADRIRASQRLRSTLRMLACAAPTPESAVSRAALAAGVNLRHVRVVSGPSLPAFTAGFWRPTIFVAADLAQRIPPAELSAVIAHEDAHRRRRDPLRLSVWRFLGCMLFFLPALRRLADDMSDEAEVAADDEAIRRADVSPLVLASALLAIAQQFGGRATLGSAATAFHRDDILGRRVRRLAGEDAPVGTHLTRRSALGASLALTVVWLSGVTVAHPLPAGPMHGAVSSQEARHHCSHDHGWAITHLFCRGFQQGSQRTATDCPHAK